MLAQPIQHTITGNITIFHLTFFGILRKYCVTITCSHINNWQYVINLSSSKLSMILSKMILVPPEHLC